MSILGRASATGLGAVLLPAFFLFKVSSNPGIIQIAVLVSVQLSFAAVIGYFSVFSKQERQNILTVLLGQAIRRSDNEAMDYASVASKPNEVTAASTSRLAAWINLIFSFSCCPLWIFSHHPDLQPRCDGQEHHRKRAGAVLQGLRNHRYR